MGSASQVVHCAYSGVGGTGSLVSALCPVLQRRYGVGTSVVFAGVEPLHVDYGRRLEEGGVPYTHISKRRGLDPRFFGRLANSIKCTGATKVVLHGGGVAWVYSVLRWLGVKQRMILVEHGPEHALRSMEGYARRVLGLPWAEAVVCVSPHLAESMRSLYALWLDRKPLYVIPNGVDCELFADGTGQRQRDVLLMVGTLSSSKDHETLLGAFELLSRERPLELWLVGDGLLRTHLEKRATELRILPKVKFFGNLPEREVARLLGAAGVFTFCSKGEGAPLALLEAMAAGCPVVASDVAGIRGLVEDEVNGLLVTPTDPRALAKGTLRLLEEAELASRLAREARRVVLERHCLEVAAERWARLLTSPG